MEKYIRQKTHLGVKTAPRFFDETHPRTKAWHAKQQNGPKKYGNVLEVTDS